MAGYEYTHGGNIYDENGLANQNIIDFSANINPLGLPDDVIAAAKQAIEHANLYPDSACRRLASELAEFENVGRNNILCAGGASDIIFRTVYAVRPKKILVTAPSFSDYERAGDAAGAEVVFYPLNQENGFAIPQEIIPAILKASPDMVFLCNPNNPTGTLTGINLVREIAEVCVLAHSVLLVDECFLDFVPDSQRYSAKALLTEYRDVVVVKALTKLFAMPGLRLGYAISNSEALLDRMRLCGADWPVSNIAQTAGLAALKNGALFINKSVRYIQKEREHMINELKILGFMTYESSANFIFFHCDPNVDLHGVLYQNGFLIRDCANFEGLERGYYRTAVLTEEKNTRLLEAMRGVRHIWQSQL
jgi:threonine-phosphate decarboxylase